MTAHAVRSTRLAESGEGLPFFHYFSTIGALLLALLLLANYLLELPRSKPADPASASSAQDLPKPRIASRIARHTVGDAQPLRAEDIGDGATSAEASPQDRRGEPTALNPVQPLPQELLIEAVVESKPLKNARPSKKSIRNKTRIRSAHASSPRRGNKATYSAPGYRRYASELSAAEGTLGPH